jgi:hypothetical protein
MTTITIAVVVFIGITLIGWSLIDLIAELLK